MERENTHGKMVEVMKGNTTMIKSMGSEYIHGWMVEDMKDIGRTERDKAEESIYCQQELVGKEYGIKIKE